MHRLPKNENERNEWLSCFNIDPLDSKLNGKDPRICELHFVKQEAVSCHQRKPKYIKYIPSEQQGTNIVR